MEAALVDTSRDAKRHAVANSMLEREREALKQAVDVYKSKWEQKLDTEATFERLKVTTFFI